MAGGIGKKAWVILLALLVAGLTTWIGWADMKFFDSDKAALGRLLGDKGAELVEDAKVVAWGMDPDHKPDAYYAIREISEAEFRRLAGQAGLSVSPNPPLAEAIWRLPEGLSLAGWAAPTVPPGDGLDAKGGVGRSNAWLRWHKGRIFLVALRAS